LRPIYRKLKVELFGSILKSVSIVLRNKYEKSQTKLNVKFLINKNY